MIFCWHCFEFVQRFGARLVSPQGKPISMFIVGHMLSAAVGGLAGVGWSALSGSTVLGLLASYPIGGVLGIAAFVLWCEYRVHVLGHILKQHHPDHGL